jgi:hypothetical protein
MPKLSRASIYSTQADHEAFEERQRQLEAEIERMAAAETLEEQQRIGERAWANAVERPRAARRIGTARMHSPAQRRPTRPGRVVVARRTRTSTKTAPTRGDPDDDPSEPPGHPWQRDPWQLTWAERVPVVWRFRAARCRLLEIREGVSR